VELELVTDKSFRAYGQILDGYDYSEIFSILRNKIPRPADHVDYVASEPQLEKLPIYTELKNNYYGGMEIQIGYSSGHNTLLNGLEYHRSSEIHITADDIILLIAKQDEIDTLSWTINSSRVRAFLAPAGTGVEIYATTLHLSPASVREGGYQEAVVLPKGTNTGKPSIREKNAEDRLLFAANKWLLVHPEANHLVREGAVIGITGENLDARRLWKNKT
jgi:hypothetical protein